MASTKLSAAILVINLFFFFFTLSGACDPCKHKPKPKPPPAPATPIPAPPTPPAPATPIPAPPTASCPKDVLKLGGCMDLLGVVNGVLGTPASSNCCALMQGLTDMEASLCLCTTIKNNVLGVNMNVPVALSAMASACAKSVPRGFQCT